MYLKAFLILAIISSSLIGYSQELYRHILENDYKAVKLYQESVNVQNEPDPTPLMFAVYKSDLKMVKLLVKKGADINRKGIISHGDFSEFSYGSCLTVAAGENKIEILKYLLSQGANIDEEEAIINGESEYVDKGSELAWTPLQWALIKGNIDIVKYLVRKGADVNKFGIHDKSILALAYDCNNQELIDFLISKGAKLYNRPEMLTKNRVLLKDDSIVQKYFSQEEISTLNYFLKTVDSIIIGKDPTIDLLKNQYTDSLKSKLDKHTAQYFNTLFSNHDFNTNTLKNISLKDSTNLIWEVITRDITYHIDKDKLLIFPRKYIVYRNKILPLIQESLLLNNNLHGYLEGVSALGEFSYYKIKDFVFINSLIDRERLYVSLILFTIPFPEFKTNYEIERDNLGRDTNMLFYRYKNAIELEH